MKTRNLFQLMRDAARRCRKWLVLGGILLVIAMLYLPACDIYLFGDDFDCLNGAYATWEDPFSLFENGGFFFRPILFLLYFLTYRLFGMYAPAYMLRMILLHLINVAVLYCLLLSLTDKIAVAGMTTLLWGTSPLHCEATIWGGGQSDALVTLFVLLIVWYCARQKERRWQFKHHAMLACLTLGALGSKETWIILPVLLAGFFMVVLQVPLLKTIKICIIPCLLAAGYLFVFMVLPRYQGDISFIDYATAPTFTSVFQKFL